MRSIIRFQALIALSVATLSGLPAFAGAPARQDFKWGDAGYSYFVWNENPGSALFVKQETSVSQLSNQIIYRDHEFSISLLQPLSLSHGNDKQFYWWVTIESEKVQRMVSLRETGKAGSQDNDLGIRFEDLGKLKLIVMRSGVRLLYTMAGDGQLRLVSLTNASGQHLLIDYGQRGVIDRIRDDGSREAQPEYSGNEIKAMLQTWYQSGSRYLALATFK